jgi:hypothetical protein
MMQFPYVHRTRLGANDLDVASKPYSIDCITGQAGQYLHTRRGRNIAHVADVTLAYLVSRRTLRVLLDDIARLPLSEPMHLVPREIIGQHVDDIAIQKDKTMLYILTLAIFTLSS